jgi:hypothetical protein
MDFIGGVMKQLIAYVKDMYLMTQYLVHEGSGGYITLEGVVLLVSVSVVVLVILL